MPLSVRVARDIREVEQAYDLAAHVFGTTYEQGRALKQTLLAEVEPIASPADVIVAVENRRVLGLIRLIERRLRFEKEQFRVCGITSVAVAGPQRGRGLGAGLMKAAIREGRRRGDDLSVLFARRALDGWYLQFGFSGIGQHIECEITVPGGEEPRTNGWEAGFRPDTVAGYAALYEKAYRALPGTFLRPPAWWKRLAARLRARPDVQFLVLRGPRRTLRAYAIFTASRIVEVGVSAQDAGIAASSLVAEMSRRGVPPAFAMHPAHVVMRALYPRNHTLKVRRAWDGGHMAAPLTAAAATRLRSRGISAGRTIGKAEDIMRWPTWTALDEF